MLEALYVAAQILSDIGSLRILNIMGFSIDGGTFIYPITFTLRDLIHKKFGKAQAQRIVWLAALINIVMACFFWLIAILPADVIIGKQLEFGLVLMPAFRIVLASIIAEVASELIDTEVYHWFVNKITHKKQWLRVLVSNLVSIPLDSIIFCLIAFYDLMPIEIVVSIIITNIVIKFLVTLISLPSIYLVKSKN